jgi:Ser/Thr protein kinase RdoA (MazF antagonist)
MPFPTFCRICLGCLSSDGFYQHLSITPSVLNRNIRSGLQTSCLFRGLVDNNRREFLIKKIAKLFELNQEKILRMIAERYGLDQTTIKKLGGFESYVFQSGNLILKVTHSLRRSDANLLGEIEFVQYLAAKGLNVAAPVKSFFGQWVERIPIDEGCFLVYAFQEAHGKEPSKKQLNPSFYKKWGQLTGKLHKLSKDYRPSDPHIKRQEWHEEEVLDFKKHIPASQKIIHQKKEKLFKWLHSLPKSSDSYGLTHNDIHYGNIHFADGKLCLFDFDDCTYHWFVNDIAIAIHSVLPDYAYETRFSQIAERFLVQFMDGYSQESQLEKVWLTYLPDFLRLYDLLNYGIFYQNWDMDHLSPARKTTLKRVRHRIENEICIVSSDFLTE